MGTRGVWLETGARWSPLMTWLTESEPQHTCGLGVVILPPIGYESSSSHRLWRLVAEALAHRGVTTLRVDVAGTGDSAGLLADVDDLAEWRAALPAAATFLRSIGAVRVAVIGCQLGATLALLDGAEAEIAGLVTIEPVLSGRRFVRSLRLMAVESPDALGGLTAAGYELSAPLLVQLSRLRIRMPTELPTLAIPGQPAVEAALERPAEEAEASPTLVRQIADWVRALGADQAPMPSPVDAPTCADLRHRGGAIREEVIAVGQDRLIGVLTTPTPPPAELSSLYVLVNSGSDPHSGPGRAWVELARDLALRGQSTVRLDLRGWGESPDGPAAPGRPYDAHTLPDVLTAVAALRRRTSGPIVLGGLCAGAWIALAAAREADVATVVLNPQLYWEPGDPVEALMTTTRERRASEIEQIKEVATTGRWDAEDARGLRPPAGEWLDDLVRLEHHSSLLFAEGDDGLEYLRDRLQRRMDDVQASGVISVTELAGVDHALHRTWLRPSVYATIGDELERVLSAEETKAKDAD